MQPEGIFCVTGYFRLQKQADGTREKYTKTERFPLHRTHKVFLRRKFSFEICFGKMVK